MQNGTFSNTNQIPAEKYHNCGFWLVRTMSSMADSPNVPPATTLLGSKNISKERAEANAAKIIIKYCLILYLLTFIFVTPIETRSTENVVNILYKGKGRWINIGNYLAECGRLSVLNNHHYHPPGRTERPGTWQGSIASYG